MKFDTIGLFNLVRAHVSCHSSKLYWFILFFHLLLNFHFIIRLNFISKKLTFHLLWCCDFFSRRSKYSERNLLFRRISQFSQIDFYWRKFNTCEGANWFEKSFVMHVLMAGKTFLCLLLSLRYSWKWWNMSSWWQKIDWTFFTFAQKFHLKLWL